MTEPSRSLRTGSDDRTRPPSIFAGPVSNPAVDRAGLPLGRLLHHTHSIEARETLEKPEGDALVGAENDPVASSSPTCCWGVRSTGWSPRRGPLLADAATALGVKGGNMVAKRLASTLQASRQRDRRCRRLC